MKKNINTAFTLVELIVVITILAVLATVAFISFQGYTSSSRDSVRLADLKNISKSFEINRTKNIDFPLPDKKVDISASGTIFQYQGELSQNILKSDLNIFDGGLDPVTKKPYGYAVNFARNKFQIIGFLENNENTANISNSTTFADNSDKYIKSSGDSLGILLDETTNEIITVEDGETQVDILSHSQTYNYLLGNKIAKGGNEVSKKIIGSQFSTCKELLNTFPNTVSGEYYFPVMGTVYCEMQLHGGGWTAVGKYLDISSIEENDYYNIGNYLVKNSNEFLAYVQYNNDTQTGSFLSNVVYDSKDKWYLENHKYFGEISNRYTVNSNSKLGYGKYNLDKYLNYGSIFAILRFYKDGMVFRYNDISGNDEVFSTQVGCITSSYVDPSTYPYGSRDTIQFSDISCSESINDTKVGLLFR